MSNIISIIALWAQPAQLEESLRSRSLIMLFSNGRALTNYQSEKWESAGIFLSKKEKSAFMFLKALSAGFYYVFFFIAF